MNDLNFINPLDIDRNGVTPEYIVALEDLHKLITLENGRYRPFMDPIEQSEQGARVASKLCYELGYGAGGKATNWADDDNGVSNHSVLFRKMSHELANELGTAVYEGEHPSSAVVRILEMLVVKFSLTPPPAKTQAT